MDGMAAVVIKVWRLVVCYNGFYSRFGTTLQTIGIGRKAWDEFKTTFTFVSSPILGGSTMVQLAEMRSPLATKAVMVGRGVATIPT